MNGFLRSALACCAIIGFYHHQNNSIVVTNIEYQNNKIPQSFEGFKILQISDLHNKQFGRKQKPLIEKTKKLNPDIIIITGDFIKGQIMELSHCLDYIREAVKIAPVYYVTGNHEEKAANGYEVLWSLLKPLGVHNMNNRSERIWRDSSSIQIIGMRDTTINNSFLPKIQAMACKNEFTMVLSHSPEKFSEYAKTHMDLIFTGHAHGGQIRIPFVGGLFAPSQGFLPKYTSGQHRLKNTTMVVSRGLGGSIFPMRLFNRPEMVMVTIKK